LIDQTAEHRAKLAALDRQKAQKEAELATIAATVGKFEHALPILQERVDIRKTLFDHNTGSKVNYLEILQALVDQQQDLIIQNSRLREADAALAAISETRAQAAAEYRRTLSSELVEAERKVAGLSQDLIKAEQRTRLQLLTAPVDGVVQQLAVQHRRGRDSGAIIARRCAAGQPSGDRGNGIEPRHRLRACRTGRRDQGRHLQFHTVRPAARPSGERVAGRHYTGQAAG
jgi:hypothetical protein